MLNLYADAFCKAYNDAHPLMSEQAIQGLSALVAALVEDPNISDLRWAAYMLATVKHECANTWQPIEEYGKGQGRPYGVPVQVQDADGTTYNNTYYGRGFVQLTWKANYDRMGRALGMGNLLVLHPEHALELQTATQILSCGMRLGMFTGRKLADYINDTQCDYLNARRIINGLDRADVIQGYAQALEQMLNASPKSLAVGA